MFQNQRDREENHASPLGYKTDKLPQVDRPISWIHYRVQLPGWHPIVAMPQPSTATSWTELAAIGIGGVLRLSEESPTYDPSPLKMVGEFSLEDLYESPMPSDTESELQSVRAAVDVLTNTLRKTGVAVHCVGGRGRTGTIVGAFLCSNGFYPDLVEEILDRAYKKADRPGWPESDWQRSAISAGRGGEI